MQDILKVENLRVRFHDAAPDQYAVDGVSFTLAPGEILGLVGESGSGKSVTAMTVCGLLDWERAAATGSVALDGRDILACSEKEILGLLGDEVGFVFQEPMTSMDPVQRIGPQVEECLRIHKKFDKPTRRALALEAMEQAELDQPEKLYRKYPHELSGGMLQRVLIAAAILSKPKLLLADEPTTALDVTTQGEILRLLRRLNRERGMAMLFISHDLHVVRRLCDRVAVMQGGRIVEQGAVEEIFHQPKEDYTRRLLAAIPSREKDE